MNVTDNHKLTCQFCGKPLQARRKDALYHPECRMKAHRRGAQRACPAQIVLSLFPGADLFGRAFEELGFCVVRGPELLLGQDVRNFHVPPGRFDGVIGGPPCQFFSRARISEFAKHDNLIPEFVRIVEEAAPRWAVMENVPEAASAAPDWDHVFLSDWNCGGLTFRRRGFWFYGVPAPLKPPVRPGRAEHSVLASSWNVTNSDTKLGALRADEAARLQGYPQLGAALVGNLPGTFCSNGKWRGVSGHSRNVFAVHVLGNGVPRALGEYVARHVAQITVGFS